MENREIAVKASGLTKYYRLGVIGSKTLKEDIQSLWAKMRGRDDPNMRIGIDKKQYGKKFAALDNVDLTIYRGERVGIIGCNGSGKSTLLKLMSRITAPSMGDIEIWGRISSLLEIGTGFHREMTGRENIYMNGAILGMTKDEITSKIEDIIAFSEVGEFIDTPVKRYSSGMLVKLAFSVAAHLDSEILVMDEVLAVGDMAFQKKCLEKMREAADKEGRTVLYVSHNMETIRRLCDRCIVLDKGKVIYDGEPEQAIAVYMNHNFDENSVSIDLKGKSNSKNDDITMEHLQLCGKSVPIYSPVEELKLTLTVNSKIKKENVIARLTFRDTNDIGIGTAWSNTFDIDSGRTDHSIAMPLEMLAKGTMYVSIGLYQSDEIGRKIAISHVTRAFQIEIDGTPAWDTSAFGYIELKSMRVSKMI